MAMVGAPEAWSISEVDPGVTARRDLGGRPDVVIAFVRSGAELSRWAPRLVKALSADASSWVAWPRKASGHVSDVTEQLLRDELLPTGLVDNKVAALDEDWSGLRFVWRREHRERVRQRAER